VTPGLASSTGRLRIVDPYAGPGVYRKAQLHCHTARSDGHLPPQALLERYRDAGYEAVVITDHDTVTACDDLNDGTFLALPGVETTIPRPFRPLGPHLGRLGSPGPLHLRTAQACIDATVAAGGVVCLHHPSWTGNLGTGGWSLREMLRLRGYHLVEICNHHSRTEEDVRRWAAVARARGPGAPVGASAGDDLHRESDFNQAWVMVKTQALTADAVLAALRGLSFYASAGPVAEFGAEGGGIRCVTDAAGIRFVDARGVARYGGRGPEAVYVPEGDEEFVRVECLRADGRPAAWSQAFWVLREG
jgi:hypothetical protein